MIRVLVDYGSQARRETEISLFKTPEKTPSRVYSIKKSRGRRLGERFRFPPPKKKKKKKKLPCFRMAGRLRANNDP